MNTPKFQDSGAFRTGLTHARVDTGFLANASTIILPAQWEEERSFGKKIHSLFHRYLQSTVHHSEEEKDEWRPFSF